MLCSRLRSLRTVGFYLLSTVSALAQSPESKKPMSPPAYEVTQIAGLPDAKSNMKGQLISSDTDLIFTNPDFRAEIPFNRMTSVTVGDEKIETGGKTGQIARKVIPYGGGLALAAVMRKSVELVTIEYLDANGGYRGAVFVVPKSSSRDISERVSTRLSDIAPSIPTACQGRNSTAASVVVEPIAARDVDVPSEYRVLLYENLMEELRSSKSGALYIRPGSSDAGTGCSAMTLVITVTGFRKGNQVLRASTGPIGFFVGKTSISYHAKLIAPDGTRLMEENMTSNNRMDSESLGVAKSAAKAVSKKMRKVLLQTSAR